MFRKGGTVRNTLVLSKDWKSSSLNPETQYTQQLHRKTETDIVNFKIQFRIRYTTKNQIKIWSGKLRTSRFIMNDQSINIRSKTVHKNRTNQQQFSVLFCSFSPLFFFLLCRVASSSSNLQNNYKNIKKHKKEQEL